MNTFLTLLGTAAGLLTTWLGIEKQEEAYSEEQAKENERYQTQLGMTRESIAYQKQQDAYAKRQDAKTWKWKEEERNFSRGQDLVNRFTGLVERDSVLKNNLSTVWGR